MPSTRRTLLVTAATVPTVSGCLGLGEDGPEDSGGSPDGADDGTTAGALELDFGERVMFTNDQGVKLAMELSNPRLRETVAVLRDGNIIVDSPEDTRYFLFVTATVANEGESALEPPGGLSFRTDGATVERTFVRTPGRKYRDIGELAPGESATATIAFPAPADADTGTVSLSFQTLFQSPPARWTFDYADVPTEAADLERDGLGDPIIVEKDAYAYEFTPVEAHVTRSYSYGGGQEHTAPEGSQFALVTARAENVGDQPVKLPTPYDVRLDADGSSHRAGRFKRADERYPGRVELTPPGEAIEGVLPYEVPASASSFTLRFAVGNETFASWPIQPESG
jgi:hypothetical protein